MRFCQNGQLQWFVMGFINVNGLKISLNNSVMLCTHHHFPVLWYYRYITSCCTLTL